MKMQKGSFAGCVRFPFGKPGIGKCFRRSHHEGFRGALQNSQGADKRAPGGAHRSAGPGATPEGQDERSERSVKSLQRPTCRKHRDFEMSEELARSSKRLAEIERSESFSSKSKPTQPVHMQSKRRKRAYGQGAASVQTTPEKAESITATNTSLCTSTMPVQPSRQRSLSLIISYAGATCTSDTTLNGNGATQPNKKEGQKPDPLHSSPKEVGEVWQTVAIRKTRQRPATIKPTTSSLAIGQVHGAQRISKRVFYVGGVSPECSSEDLLSFCEKHCRVIQCHVMSSSL